MDARTLDFLKHNAPCYLYDKAIIERRTDTLLETFAGFSIIFSVKANPFAPVLRTLANKGVGADAASAGEVRLALDAGMRVQDIYYSAAGKTDADIEAALGHCVLTADSASEIERIDAICKKRNVHAAIGVRVNPNFTIDDMRGASGKFGVCEEDMPALGQKLASLSNVSVVGIHVHVKSQQLDTEKLGQYYENVFAMAKRIHALPGFDIRFVNFGGGVGTVYDEAMEKPLEMNVLARYAASVRADNDSSLHARLIIESGRYLTCDAGTYHTPVIDIKHSRGKQYVIVENGLNGFLRPVMTHTLNHLLPNQTFPVPEPLYTRAHAFEFSINSTEDALETYDIVGNLCTAADILLGDAVMPKAHVGDIVTVTKAGSYAYALTPMLFSSHPAPKQFLVAEEEFVEK